MRRAAIALLLSWPLAAGCRVSLEGAPCPCLDGYTCDDSLGICVPISGAVGDSGEQQSDASEFDPDASGVTPDADFTTDAGLGLPDGSDGVPDAGAGEPDGGDASDAGS